MVLEGLDKMAEEWTRDPLIGNDALLVALADCRKRCDEEARRARSEVDMRRAWAERQPKEAELL